MFNHAKSRIQKAVTERFVAHRGANNESPGNTLPHLPENTLPAMLEAYRVNAKYVECDIHKTSDNRIVVLHDTTLRRTARYNPDLAGTLTESAFNQMLDTPITELNYETQVSRVDVGSYADYLGNKFRGTKIPLLSEFIDQLIDHPERKLIVELKAGSHDIVPLLTQLISNYKLLSNQLLFISFDLQLIKAAKEKLPQYQHLLLTVCDSDTAIIEEYEHPVNNLEDLMTVIQLVKAANLDGIDLQYSATAKEFIPFINKNDLCSAIWTYAKDDTLAMATSMLAAGADLINTNQPEFMFAQVKVFDVQRVEDGANNIDVVRRFV